MSVSSSRSDAGNKSAQSKGKPLLWLFLLVIALLPFVLAVWQWQRGQDKQALLNSLTSAMGVPPVSLVYREAEPPPEFSRVVLDQARPAGAVLELRNSFLGELSGRRILQPWRLGNDQSLVLLDLGWLPDGVALPRLDEAGIRPLGHWMPVPRHFVLSGAVTGSAGVVDVIDMAGLQRRYPGQWHQGVVVLENSPQPLQHWAIVPEFMPERHYAYALQWLLLGVCLSVGWRVLWRRRHGQR